MLRLLAFLALGATIGGLLVAALGDPGTGLGIFGFALPVFIVSTVFVSVTKSLSPSLPSPAAVTAARDARRLGRARIDAVRQTGTFINEQPLCEIDVTVVALDGGTWATTVRTIVPLIELAAYQAGLERDVVILLDGGPEVVFADGELSPTERERLVVPARSEVEVRPIEAGTRVHDGRRRGPLLGVGRRGRPWRRALFAVATVAAATVVVLPYRDGVALTMAAWQDGRWSADMRTPDSLQTAKRALQAEIGHDQVVSIVVTPDAVIVDAPIRAGEQATDEWNFRAGRVTHEGAASSQPRVAQEQFPWSDLALDRVWPALQEASDQIGLPIGTTPVSIGRSSDGDVESPTFNESVGVPLMSFGLDDDYRRASFTLSADGSRLTPVG